MRNPQFFSGNLNREMKRRKLSGAELARQSGVSEKAIRKILHKKSGSPTLATACFIAETLNCSMDALLEKPQDETESVKWQEMQNR